MRVRRERNCGAQGKAEIGQGQKDVLQHELDVTESIATASGARRNGLPIAGDVGREAVGEDLFDSKGKRQELTVRVLFPTRLERDEVVVEGCIVGDKSLHQVRLTITSADSGNVK